EAQQNLPVLPWQEHLARTGSIWRYRRGKQLLLPQRYSPLAWEFLLFRSILLRRCRPPHYQPALAWQVSELARREYWLPIPSALFLSVPWVSSARRVL